MAETLASSAAQRLERCRRNLVLDLYLRRGSVWEAIAELRARWQVEATPQVPPETPWIHFPPACPESDALPEDWEDRFDDDWSPEAGQWVDDLGAMYERVIRPECRLGYLPPSPTQWIAFLAACVLLDPPETELLEFAAFAPFKPQYSFAQAWHLPPPGEDQLDGPPTMVVPPIVRRHPDVVDGAWRWFTQRLVNELHLRLRERGVDVGQTADEVLQDTGLLAELEHRLRPEPGSAFIQVTATTTDADVRNARRLIADGFGFDSGRGAPSLDALTAVQCAILSRRGWTEVAIARRLGFQVSNDSYGTPRRSYVTRRHIQRGREILAEGEKPAE